MYFAYKIIMQVKENYTGRNSGGQMKTLGAEEKQQKNKASVSEIPRL